MAPGALACLAWDSSPPGGQVAAVTPCCLCSFVQRQKAPGEGAVNMLAVATLEVGQSSHCPIEVGEGQKLRGLLGLHGLL